MSLFNADIYATRRRVIVVTGDERAPEACATCRNLVVDANSAGRVVLSCMLEQAAVQPLSKPDPLAKNGPTAAWARRALDMSVPLDSRRGVDATAAEFRKQAAIADDACPILERLREVLPTTPDEAVINLTPPQPVLGYAAMREAFGWEP